jgi:hypothetical protein
LHSQPMTDPKDDALDETKASDLAKRLFALPPKPQAEMKIGKREKPAAKPAKKNGRVP